MAPLFARHTHFQLTSNTIHCWTGKKMWWVICTGFISCAPLNSQHASHGSAFLVLLLWVMLEGVLSGE
jgi:hypothetical protein